MNIPTIIVPKVITLCGAPPIRVAPGEAADVTDALLGLVLLVGVMTVAAGVAQIYEPAAYIWVGWCLLFVGWRLIGTRRTT